MSLQVHAWRATTSFSASATNYITPLNGQVFTATELSGSCFCLAAGSFSNWQVVLPSAPAAGKSVTFTLRINGSDTAAVITISGTATVGTYTGTIALADGDKITIKSVPSSTPTASTPIMSWSFNSTTANESIYGCGGVNGTLTSTTRINQVLFRPDTSNFQTTSQEVVACPGSITKAQIEITADVGAGTTGTYVINKNGVAQDGTSGTPDTRIVFNNTGTIKSATFTLALVAGDQLSWTYSATGSPASHRPTTSVKFVSTNPGESHYGGTEVLNLSNTNTLYLQCGNGSNTTIPTVEASGQVNIGLTGFKLKNLYIMTSGGVGAGAAVGYTWNLKKAGSTTALTAQILNAGVAANDLTGNVTYQPQDIIGFEVIPQNTPTARGTSWAAIQSQIGGSGAGGGNSNNGKKGGGGGLNVLNPGGALIINLGNPGMDIGSGS